MTSKVLIADDNPDLIAILSARLRALAFTVIEAGDGARAIDLIQKNEPDIVVLDVMMPELNGFQVCRRMKQDPRLSKIPVILLTAKNTEADKFWGSEVGADVYLTKPADPAAVVREVQNLLAAK